MKIALLSDTHMAHWRVPVSPCDLLIHCGDFTRRGSEAETRDFFAWLGAQPAEHKVVVCGNHDLFCEAHPTKGAELAAAAGARLLFDEEVLMGGLRIWGSPVTPAFRSLAFNRERGTEIGAHWDKIPRGLDLLVTHGPPRGAGDRVFFGARVGCADLTKAVHRAEPRVHAYGHIHEGAGAYQLPPLKTCFLNVATRRLMPRAVRRPVEIEISPLSD